MMIEVGSETTEVGSANREVVVSRQDGILSLQPYSKLSCESECVWPVSTGQNLVEGPTVASVDFQVESLTAV